MNILNPENPILSVLIGEEDIQRISTSLPEISILQIPVSEKDWNDHLSPWPAEKVFRKGADFSGHADSFLKDQVEPVLQEAKKDYSRIFLCGYSLAGLFALYASARIEGIDGVMSASGSLWYPGFTEYLKRNPSHGEFFYLSVGSTEKNSRSPILSTVEEKTRETKDILEAQNKHVFYELREGGHFSDPCPRIIRGIEKLAGMCYDNPRTL
ncbi:MAG: hypothetical protein ACI4WR_07015 [Bulleidia sp.]